MSDIIRRALKRGMNIIYGVEEPGLGGLSMGIVSLKEGDRFGETLNCREAVLVLLHGSIKFRGEGFDHGVLPGRENVFAGAPFVAYCPPGMYSIKAKSDCAVAVFRYKLDKKNKGAAPMLITPQNIFDEVGGEFTSRIVCDLSDSESGLQVGETLLPAGSASGIPSPLFDKVASGESGGAILFCFEDGMGEADLDLDGSPIKVQDNDAIVATPKSKLSFTPGDKDCFCLWAVANS